MGMGICRRFSEPRNPVKLTMSLAPGVADDPEDILEGESGPEIPEFSSDRYEPVDTIGGTGKTP